MNSVLLRKKCLRTARLRAHRGGERCGFSSLRNCFLRAAMLRAHRGGERCQHTWLLRRDFFKAARLRAHRGGLKIHRTLNSEHTLNPEDIPNFEHSPNSRDSLNFASASLQVLPFQVLYSTIILNIVIPCVFFSHFAL